MLERFKPKVTKHTRVSVWPTEKAIATAVVKQKKDGQPILKSCEYQKVENQKDQSNLLKKMYETDYLKKHQCVSLMSASSYELLMIEALDVPEEEVSEAMRWRVKDMIDYPVEQAVIEVFNIPVQKSSGDMMYVVVAKSEDVAKRVKLLLDAGFNLKSIEIMELSMRNVSSLLHENKMGVAMVWLGETSGSITMTKNETLYFTRQLSGSDKLFGSLYSETVTDEMKMWLDSVVIEIQRTLDFYESQYKQTPASGVVLAPLVKPIEGLAEYLSNQLGASVRYLGLDEVFEIDEGVDLDKAILCLPAIGAALDISEVSA